MKDRLESLSVILLLSFIASALTMVLAGCGTDKVAVRSLGDVVRNLQTPSPNSSNDQMAAMEKSVALVQQVVPIETRRVSLPTIHGTPVDDLRPVASGPGVVVCEPRSNSTDASVTAFATACGDWLHLIVAGQPEFGQTPTWESLARARQELSRNDMALNLDQACELYRILGVDEVAIGMVQGTANRCTITYRAFGTPSAKAIGKPVVLSGSETQILSELPTAARSMAILLGARSPIIPASVGTANPDDFAFLGGIKHGTDVSALPENQQKRLVSLTQHIPTAGMLYTQSLAMDKETTMIPAIKTLVAQLPGNPLVYTHIGWQDDLDMLAYRSAIEAEYRKYPNNYLLATQMTWLSREDFDSQAERDSAEQAVRSAYRNPDAWLTLAYTLSNEADAVRVGRWGSMISSAEWSYIDKAYAQRLEATRQSVQLDPKDGAAWTRVAEAATCVGDNSLADQAIQKAYMFDPKHSDVYWWALEMYAPKWNDDPEDLTKWANRAAADTYDNDDDLLAVYDELMGANCLHQASTLIESHKAKLRARIAKNANDGMAHWSLAACYYHQEMYNQAADEYTIAGKLLPNEPAIPYYLGLSYDYADRGADAITAYQRTLQIDPDHHTAHFKLAYDLKHARSFAEAVPQFQQALRINPYYAEAHYGLGDLYDMEHKPALAIPQYQLALRYEPSLISAYLTLAGDLDSAGQYDQSLQVAYESLLVDPIDNQVIGTVEDDFLNKRQFDKTIEICNDVLASNVYGREGQTSLSLTHENLAEAYIGKGDKQRAVAEWHTVLTYNDPRMTPVANRFLARYQ